MKELISRLMTNWKSTVIAVMIIVVTTLLALKHVTPTDWSLMMGAIAGLYGLFKKDNDI